MKILKIRLDIYSHVLPSLQEVAAYKSDRIFEGAEDEDSEGNVSNRILKTKVD